MRAWGEGEKLHHTLLRGGGGSCALTPPAFDLSACTRFRCLRSRGDRGRRWPLATEQHHVLRAVRGDEAAHLWLCLGGARARFE